MKLKKYSSHPKSERGQSLTELAVIVVIMIIILAGVVDLGGVIFQYLAMRDAAQEGASYATASHFPTAATKSLTGCTPASTTPTPTWCW